MAETRIAEQAEVPSPEFFSECTLNETVHIKQIVHVMKKESAIPSIDTQKKIVLK